MPIRAMITRFHLLLLSIYYLLSTIYYLLYLLLYMRDLISILMAGWLFTVTALGWCCHPPTACGHAPCEAEFGECATSTCCDECPQKPCRPSRPIQPCKCILKCVGICKSLPTPKVELETKQDVRYDLALVECSSLGVNATAMPCGRSGGRSVKTESHLRLHLVNQILLI